MDNYSYWLLSGFLAWVAIVVLFYTSHRRSWKTDKRKIIVLYTVGLIVSVIGGPISCCALLAWIIGDTLKVE
jgi:hypothetical protein